DPVRTRGNGSGGQAMIASEDERQRAFIQRFQRTVVQLLTHLRDLADIFLVLVSGPLRFRNGCREIALVDCGPSERRDLIANASDAEGRWPHVDATAPGAEIEGNTNEVDRLH